MAAATPVNNTECAICCEKYNKSSNYPIICSKPDCNFDCCSSCFKTFVLDNTNHPTCMNCKTILSDQFIVDNINKTFYNGPFKKQLIEKLYENEQSKMPETMPFVKQRVDINNCEKENKLIVQEINELKNIILDKQANLRSNYSKIYKLKNGENVNKEKQSFIVPCRNENCKGFLNQKYRCEICNTHTCSKCLEFIGHKDSELFNNHECKKENLDSAELIRKETKPCPKCGTRIYKIDGCDQMWCTGCKVAFSWKKGTIETGTIHNPHYYQWTSQQMNGNFRNPLDVICGGLQDFRNLRSNFLFFYKTCVSISKVKINDELSKNFCGMIITLVQDTIFRGFIHNRENRNSPFKGSIIKIHQSLNDIINNIIPRIVEEINILQDNRSLRVDLMLNEITQEKFKVKIMKNHIDLRIKQEELQLYQVIRNFGIDLFNEYSNLFNDITEICNMINHSIKNFSIDTINNYTEILFQQVRNIDNFWINKLIESSYLCKYFNEQTSKLSVTYNRTVPVFNKYFCCSTTCKFNIRNKTKQELYFLDSVVTRPDLVID